MKKTLTAALTASMLAAAVLAGCGQKAEAPAETTTEAAAEETTAEETTAEETTAEETEAEAQGVPAFEYTGENAYVAAICDYMKENIVKNYEPADVSIPAVRPSTSSARTTAMRITSRYGAGSGLTTMP